jgi:hypothetical protein
VWQFSDLLLQVQVDLSLGLTAVMIWLWGWRAALSFLIVGTALEIEFLGLRAYQYDVIETASVFSVYIAYAVVKRGWKHLCIQTRRPALPEVEVMRATSLSALIIAYQHFMSFNTNIDTSVVISALLSGAISAASVYVFLIAGWKIYRSCCNAYWPAR